MDPCTITKAAREQQKLLGADVTSLDQKLDLLAKQANKNMGMLGMPPAIRTLLNDFTDVVNSTMTGALSSITEAIAAKIGQAVQVTGALVALIAMVASAGNQVQLLLISQLRRELTVRILIYQLLLYHYRNILKTLNLLKSPQSTTYKKLLAALPYVRRAESRLSRIVLAESAGGIPAQISYRTLQAAFINLEQASKILSFDGSQGGKALGRALSDPLNISKQKWDYIAQTIAKDVFFKSIAQSLSYIEYLTWNYMRIATLLPIPFEAVDSIFQPNNYTEQWLKNNGVTDVKVQRFSRTEEDALLATYREGLIQRENETFLNTTAQVILGVDLLKGIIPTNIVINSLLETITNFPDFKLNLEKATSTLITTLIPLLDTVTGIRQGMEDSLSQQDSDIVLAGKEGIWLTKLNTIILLKDGILPIFEGQFRMLQDQQTIDALITYIDEHAGEFVIADRIPKIIVQSLQILRAPFSARSLEESIIYTTAIIKQLDRGMRIDRSLLHKTMLISEPLQQFSQLLKVASKLPPPISSIANALSTGQAQAVLGFIAGITLGTIDSIKELFDPSCPEVTTTEDVSINTNDKLNDTQDEYFGIGGGETTAIK